MPLRIAILRALYLGDLLCAVPALRSLRKLHPRAEITLIGLPWASSFRRRYPAYLDRFIGFPGFPGLPEAVPDLDAIPRFLRRIQARHFDLVIQMQGNGRLTNAIALLFGAERTSGFYPRRGWCPDPASFWPYPRALHEIRRNLALMRNLGAEPEDEGLEFPLRESDHAEWREATGQENLEVGCYACLHPGARDASKRWPPAHFARIGDALAAQGLRIVLTGSAAERPITQAVAAGMRSPVVDTASDISYGALAAMLAGARLLVSNDTAVAHLAAALRLPSVTVFFATDPRRWAPLDCVRHRTVHDARGVAPEPVLVEALRLLRAPFQSQSSSVNAMTSSVVTSSTNDSR